MVKIRIGFSLEFDFDEFMEEIEEPFPDCDTIEKESDWRIPIYRKALKSLGINKQFEVRPTHILWRGEPNVSYNLVLSFRTKEEAVLFKFALPDGLNYYGFDNPEDGTPTNRIVVN